MTAAKWTVFAHDGRWIVWPPYPMGAYRVFADWATAYDFADRMARGLA